MTILRTGFKGNTELTWSLARKDRWSRVMRFGSELSHPFASASPLKMVCLLAHQVYPCGYEYKVSATPADLREATTTLPPPELYSLGLLPREPPVQGVRFAMGGSPFRYRFLT